MMQGHAEERNREFAVLGDEGLFEIKKQSKKLTDRDCNESGTIPVYSSQSTNNGIMGFTSTNAEFNVNSPTLIFGDHTRSVDIALTDFCAADNVKILQPKGMNFYSLLYTATVWKKRIPDLGYARHWRRAQNIRIELPVDASGEPDYTFMTQYMSICHDRKLKSYKDYVQKQLTELGNFVAISSLNEVTWHPFYISDIFSTFVPGKGGGLNHLTQVDSGGINYIGATTRNNGVLCYVINDDNTKGKILPGNCIGFIKNGDGSAGYAIYKYESFISTSDVIYGYANWINRYTGLFFVAAQDMIEHKYSHGYKRNRQHLERDRVMLPADEKGNPDFIYMEQYSKNMMIRKYHQYLQFLGSKENAEIH